MARNAVVSVWLNWQRYGRVTDSLYGKRCLLLGSDVAGATLSIPSHLEFLPEPPEHPSPEWPDTMAWPNHHFPLLLCPMFRLKSPRRLRSNLTEVPVYFTILKTSAFAKVARASNRLIWIYENLAKTLTYPKDASIPIIEAGTFAWMTRAMTHDSLKGWNLGRAKGSPKPTGIGSGFAPQRVMEGASSRSGNFLALHVHCSWMSV